MNARDFTVAFRSQAFVGYLITVVALGLIFGVLLNLVVAHFGPEGLQFTSSYGGYNRGLFRLGNQPLRALDGPEPERRRFRNG